MMVVPISAGVISLKDPDNKKYIKLGVTGVAVIVVSLLFFFLLFRLPELSRFAAVVAGILAPFLYGLYWKGTTKIACWVSFIFSTVVMLANVVAKSAFPVLLQSPINAGAFCMVAGLVIVPVVSLITPKPKKELVEDAFSCYEEKVVVTRRRSLGDKAN